MEVVFKRFNSCLTGVLERTGEEWMMYREEIGKERIFFNPRIKDKWKN
jgi:hypothetical protein